MEESIRRAERLVHVTNSALAQMKYKTTFDDGKKEGRKPEHERQKASEKVKRKNLTLEEELEQFEHDFKSETNEMLLKMDQLLDTNQFSVARKITNQSSKARDRMKEINKKIENHRREKSIMDELEQSRNKLLALIDQEEHKKAGGPELVQQQIIAKDPETSKQTSAKDVQTGKEITPRKVDALKVSDKVPTKGKSSEDLRNKLLETQEIVDRGIQTARQLSLKVESMAKGEKKIERTPISEKTLVSDFSNSKSWDSRKSASSETIKSVNFKDCMRCLREIQKKRDRSRERRTKEIEDDIKKEDKYVEKNKIFSVKKLEQPHRAKTRKLKLENLPSLQIKDGLQVQVIHNLEIPAQKVETLPVRNNTTFKILTHEQIEKEKAEKLLRDVEKENCVCFETRENRIECFNCGKLIRVREKAINPEAIDKLLLKCDFNVFDPRIDEFVEKYIPYEDIEGKYERENTGVNKIDDRSVKSVESYRSSEKEVEKEVKKAKEFVKRKYKIKELSDMLTKKYKERVSKLEDDHLEFEAVLRSVFKKVDESREVFDDCRFLFSHHKQKEYLNKVKQLSSTKPVVLSLTNDKTPGVDSEQTNPDEVDTELSSKPDQVTKQDNKQGKCGTKLINKTNEFVTKPTNKADQLFAIQAKISDALLIKQTNKHSKNFVKPGNKSTEILTKPTNKSDEFFKIQTNNLDKIIAKGANNSNEFFTKRTNHTYDTATERAIKPDEISSWKSNRVKEKRKKLDKKDVKNKHKSRTLGSSTDEDVSPPGSLARHKENNKIVEVPSILATPMFSKKDSRSEENTETKDNEIKDIVSPKEIQNSGGEMEGSGRNYESTKITSPPASTIDSDSESIKEGDKRSKSEDATDYESDFEGDSLRTKSDYEEEEEEEEEDGRLMFANKLSTITEVSEIEKRVSEVDEQLEAQGKFNVLTSRTTDDVDIQNNSYIINDIREVLNEAFEKGVAYTLQHQRDALESFKIPKPKKDRENIDMESAISESSRSLLGTQKYSKLNNKDISSQKSNKSAKTDETEVEKQKSTQKDITDIESSASESSTSLNTQKYSKTKDKNVTVKLQKTENATKDVKNAQPSVWSLSTSIMDTQKCPKTKNFPNANKSMITNQTEVAKPKKIMEDMEYFTSESSASHSDIQMYPKPKSKDSILSAKSNKSLKNSENQQPQKSRSDVSISQKTSSTEVVASLKEVLSALKDQFERTQNLADKLTENVKELNPEVKLQKAENLAAPNFLAVDNSDFLTSFKKSQNEQLNNTEKKTADSKAEERNSTKSNFRETLLNPWSLLVESFVDSTMVSNLQKMRKDSRAGIEPRLEILKSPLSLLSVNNRSLVEEKSNNHRSELSDARLPHSVGSRREEKKPKERNRSLSGSPDGVSSEGEVVGGYLNNLSSFRKRKGSAKSESSSEGSLIRLSSRKKSSRMSSRRSSNLEKIGSPLAVGSSNGDLSYSEGEVRSNDPMDHERSSIQSIGEVISEHISAVSSFE